MLGWLNKLVKCCGIEWFNWGVFELEFKGIVIREDGNQLDEATHDELLFTREEEVDCEDEGMRITREISTKGIAIMGIDYICYMERRIYQIKNGER